MPQKWRLSYLNSFEDENNSSAAFGVQRQPSTLAYTVQTGEDTAHRDLQAGWFPGSEINICVPLSTGSIPQLWQARRWRYKVTNKVYDYKHRVRALRFSQERKLVLYFVEAAQTCSHDPAGACEIISCT